MAKHPVQRYDFEVVGEVSYDPIGDEVHVVRPVEPGTVCPGCSGPITFSPCGKDGIVVYFHCPDPACIYGKPDGWSPGDPVI